MGAKRKMTIQELSDEMKNHNCDNVNCNHNDTKGLCCLYKLDNCKYRQLQKENTELKETIKHFNPCGEWDEDAHDCEFIHYAMEYGSQLTKAKEIIKELSKSLFLAKGIVRDLIDDTVDFKESKERAIYCYEQEKFDTYKKAEQFLKENV